jgi:hypothetical protein
MSEHYADQFGGICIAYSLERLLRNLPDNVSFVRMYADELAKMVLSYKNYRWFYERE